VDPNSADEGDTMAPQIRWEHGVRWVLKEWFCILDLGRGLKPIWLWGQGCDGTGPSAISDRRKIPILHGSRIKTWGSRKGDIRGTRALWVNMKRISREDVLRRWDGDNEIAERGLRPGTAGEAR